MKMNQKRTRAPKLTTLRLAAAIGPELAQLIVRRFGGRRIPRDAARLERDIAIVAEIDSGATYAEVAARFGISRSAVLKVVSDAAWTAPVRAAAGARS